MASRGCKAPMEWPQGKEDFVDLLEDETKLKCRIGQCKGEGRVFRLNPTHSKYGQAFLFGLRNLIN